MSIEEGYGGISGESYISFDTSKCSAVLIEDNALIVFEEQFKEKYKVDFSDFIEAVMKDYPEMKI